MVVYLISIVELFRKVYSFLFWMTDTHAIFSLEYLIISVKIGNLFIFHLIAKPNKISHMNWVSLVDEFWWCNVKHDAWPLTYSWPFGSHGVLLSKGEKPSLEFLWTYIENHIWLAHDHVLQYISHGALKCSQMF